MEMGYRDHKVLSAEELEHLESLKSVVEKALNNGQFSVAEVDHIKSIIWADGKVTYEELRTVHETIKEVMGDVPPEVEWMKHR